MNQFLYSEFLLWKHSFVADPTLATLTSSNIDVNKMTELPELSTLHTVIITKRYCISIVVRLSLAMRYIKNKLNLLIGESRFYYNNLALKFLFMPIVLAQSDVWNKTSPIIWSFIKDHFFPGDLDLILVSFKMICQSLLVMKNFKCILKIVSCTLECSLKASLLCSEILGNFRKLS